MIGQRFITAQSWWLATELVRRHPYLSIRETHPGDGMYDCLALVGNGKVRIQINRFGTIHVESDPDFHMTWEHVFSLDSPFSAVLDIERSAGFPEVQHAPKSSPQAIAYRVITGALVTTENDKALWDCRSDLTSYYDGMFTETEGWLDHFPEALAHARALLAADPEAQPRGEFWVFMKDGVPTGAVSTEGLLYSKRRTLDLNQRFDDNSRLILPLVAEAMTFIDPKG